LLACVNANCYDKLADQTMLGACVMTMCGAQAAKPGAVAQAQAAGAILNGAGCGAKCAPSDAGVPGGDDGGVDAGE
jgi:hypothetical protein